MDKIPDAVITLMAYEVGPVDDRFETSRSCLLAALKAAEAAGWVMVPKDPTGAMLEVGDDGYYGMSGCDVWAAMIAAAPKVG